MFEQKPEGIEDIFAPTEAGGSQTPQTPSSALPAQTPPPIESGGGLLHGKIVWLVFGVIVLVVLVGGGLYLALQGGDENTQETIVEETTETAVLPASEEAPSATPSAPQAAEATSPIPSNTETNVAVIDTDLDGISDADESAYGTSPTNPDTDNDQLSDREEILVYKTNPLLPDTDKDSYLDGAEVRAGYDPNGPGKLTDIQRATKQ